MTMVHDLARRPARFGRETLLTRVLGFVDGHIHRPTLANPTSSAEIPSSGYDNSAPATFRPSLEPHRPDDEAEESADLIESRLYLEAREQIKHRAWGRAQRLLEQLSREVPDSAAPMDLQSVRTVRRGLRRAARWPSDPDAHLELGRAYFDLDLGDAALGEFLTLERLAPERPEGFVLAALEYIYRGQYPQAIGAWTRARAIQPDLPQLDELLSELPS
jgi:tetratricopeptide (TPR) repeat protein